VWSADGGLADESSWVADAGNGVRSGMVTGAYLLNGLPGSPLYVAMSPIVQGCFPGDVVRCSGPSVPTIARREGKALTIVLSGWTVLAEAPCACALLLRRASMRGPTYLWAPGAPPQPFQDPTIEMQRVVAWGPNDGPIAFVGSVGGHDGVFLTSFPGSPPREVPLPPGGAIRDTGAIRGSFGGDGRYLFFTSAGLLFAYDSAADRTVQIPLRGPAPWPAVLGVLWLPFP
ncbi:MAG TPA: hypothetical protein VEN82_00415, partial [Actinomycetota bacterium]|nr:hypothetical protein [Actinomycetota bacterium]